MTEMLPIVAVVSVDTFHALRDHLDTIPDPTPGLQIVMDRNGWTLESIVAGSLIAYVFDHMARYPSVTDEP